VDNIVMMLLHTGSSNPEPQDGECNLNNPAR
jgi:hypothetical protein